MRKLSEVLQKAREDAGLSQRELARATGMTTGQISQIENEIQDPRFSTIAKYARGIGISLDALATYVLDAKGILLKSSLGPPEHAYLSMLHDIEMAKAEAERAAARLGNLLEKQNGGGKKSAKGKRKA